MIAKKTSWRNKVAGMKNDLLTLRLAYRHPKLPWYAKAWIALVVAYAFSPIDLIPDFIPILGQLDDLLIIPLGVIMAVRLVPAQILAECRAEVNNQQLQMQLPSSYDDK